MKQIYQFVNFQNMKNYSFSNITNEQSFGTRRSNDSSLAYLKGSEASLRIDEIKKKYDTPSRKQRIQSLKKSKEQQLYNRMAKQQTKDPTYRPSPSFGNNHLKQSFAVNRIDKNHLNRNDFDNKDFMKERSGNERDVRRYSDKENVSNVSYRANHRESEEAVFSKVREMKESILNNNSIKNSIGAKSMKYDKYQGKREFDPRVENIDKINLKIKQILNCLSQNEKNPRYKDTKEHNTASFAKEESTAKEPSFGVKVKQIEQSNGKSYKGHSHKNSDVVQKYNIFESQESKEIPQQSIINQLDVTSKPDSQRSKPYLDSYKPRSKEYSVKKIQSIAKDYELARKNKCLEEIIRTPTTYQNKALKSSTSKNHLDSIKNSSNNEKNDTLKSGKKLNDEISKIQKKIEQFQKQKRKLNIEFTPFSVKNKSTANLVVSFNGDKPTAQSKNVKQSLKNSEESSKASLNHRSSSYDIRFKSYMNRAANYQEKYSNLTNILTKEVTKSTSIYEKPKETFMREGGDFELKIHQIEVKNVQVQKEVEQVEDDIKESQIEIDEVAIKKRTDEGIEERRRIWKREEDIITTETIKSMVSLFCEQVKFDQNLRNLKIWLESSFQPDKFNKIAKFLEKEGLSMSQKQIKTIFTLDQSENNPFFSVQSFQGNYQALAIAYLDAQNHWKNKILHKFSKASLCEQGFTSQKIDLERKGYIQLQDLVRFLNIQSGTFYRNRDLFLIFRRFTPTEKLKFDGLLNEICA